MEILLRRKAGALSDEEWQSLTRLTSHVADFKKKEHVYGEILLAAQGAGVISGTEGAFGREFVADLYCKVNVPSLFLPSFIVKLLKSLTKIPRF